MIPGRVKLGIGIPSNGPWECDFGTSLLALWTKLICEPPSEEFAMEYMVKTGSMLPVNRTEIVKTLMEKGCTHILWLDDDMTFPEDVAHRLLAHGKSIVGCNASRKSPPFAPTAIGLDKKHCFTREESAGLEEVMHVGLAVMLTDIRVFKALPEPWFPMSWSAELNRYVGEDVYFCHLQRSRGVKVWVDHDLSKEIGHVGPFAYTLDLAENTMADAGV
jgi:hypothetical protein